MTSLPYFCYCMLCKSLAICSTVTFLMKGVPSASPAVNVANLAAKHSTKCPMVMREGMAWGLTTMSGVMPSPVKGRSSLRYAIPMVPFWPCLDANLSPIWGTRMHLILTFTSLSLSPLRVINTLSMTPASCVLIVTEVSLAGTLYKVFSDCMCIFSLILTLPIMTSSPLTLAPGKHIPSKSSLVYLYSSFMPMHSLRLGMHSTSLYSLLSLMMESLTR
mmetsp:Transcript_19940/g.44055  ORF Transcript_19940/g.44055 Transcript_19940/m.44055 type:complete len:218 (-) Transcript_19940:252-905(-)